MSVEHSLPPDLTVALVERRPLLWINEGWLPLEMAQAKCPYSVQHVYDAERRMHSYANLLSRLFPELVESRGVIDSPLRSAEPLRRSMVPETGEWGRWFIKCDHELPVAGSIKARGGIYEVLVHAERLALREGLISADEDLSALASDSARRLFSKNRIVVGSTGNLGLSIGIVASVLGFQVNVHMSSDAKEWKKERLKSLGVQVIQHAGDFVAAVAAGRAQAQGDPHAYFVDDERSENLFLGYSVAARQFCQQLAETGTVVDSRHPLFVYLPCGVGGAPSGITFGLRHRLGDHVHCFFAEPTASPSMLISFATGEDRPVSVRDIGLDSRTEADGLAVAQASELVASFMRPFVSGVFTVPDDHLFEDLYRMQCTQGLRIEPSAAAGFRGPDWLVRSPAGREYVANHGGLEYMRQATHILWTTGGSFVPEQEYAEFLKRARGGSPEA